MLSILFDRVAKENDNACIAFYIDAIDIANRISAN